MFNKLYDTVHEAVIEAAFKKGVRMIKADFPWFAEDDAEKLVIAGRVGLLVHNRHFAIRDGRTWSESSSGKAMR